MTLLLALLALMSIILSFIYSHKAWVFTIFYREKKITILSTYIHARDEFSGLFLSSCGRSPYPCDVDLLGC